MHFWEHERKHVGANSIKIGSVVFKLKTFENRPPVRCLVDQSVGRISALNIE